MTGAVVGLLLVMAHAIPASAQAAATGGAVPIVANLNPSPSITVKNTASPATVLEPGGPVTFTVRVTNTGPRDVTLTGLVDDVYGNLDGQGTCATAAPGRLPPTAPLLATGGAYSCSFIGQVPRAGSGRPGQSYTDAVTATAVDADGQAATGSDGATVAIADALPAVSIFHLALPSSLPDPGGTFTFSVGVSVSGSVEPVLITSLRDSVYGDLASPRAGSTCNTIVGTVVAPTALVACTFTGTFTGSAGASQTDVLTIGAQDDEANVRVATSSATVSIVPSQPFTGGSYVPLSPVRIEDTRFGSGNLAGALGPDATVEVAIAGRGGVPANAVAVVMNVTVTQPTTPGYLTLYPAGTVRPLAANVNFASGQTVPNLAVVKLGASGRIAMFNPAGHTHVIYDVAGYFVESFGLGVGRYLPNVPARIADTRVGSGGARLGPGESFDLQVAGAGGAPPFGIGAAILNVAATNTTAPSYLTIYPTGEERPLAANLNFLAGETVSNRAIVKLGANGNVTVYNAAGGADVVVDLGGTYADGPSPGALGLYTPLPPSRILDTRTGSPVPAGGTVAVQIAGRGGVPASGARAVVINVAVTEPLGFGYLTMYPSGAAPPLASDLNYAVLETRANLAVVQVGSDGTIELYSSTQAHVIFDVAGWYG